MFALGSFIGATIALLILGAIFYRLLSLVPYLRTDARKLVLSALLAVVAAIVIAAFGMADGGPLNWERAFTSYILPGCLLVVIAAMLGARGGPPSAGEELGPATETAGASPSIGATPPQPAPIIAAVTSPVGQSVIDKPEIITEARPVVAVTDEHARTTPLRSSYITPFGAITFIVAVLALVIAAVTMIRNGAGTSAQTVPGTHLVEESASNRYQGVELGWVRAEVLYRLGVPSAVVGETMENGWAPIYYTDGTRDLRNAMPEGVSIEAFQAWTWEAEFHGGTELTIEFEPTTNSVGSVTCIVLDGRGQRCDALNDIEIGQTEEQVISLLGQPNRFKYDGPSKTLRYDSLGADYTLSLGRVYQMTRFQLEAELPADPAAQPADPEPPLAPNSK